MLGTRTEQVIQFFSFNNLLLHSICFLLSELAISPNSPEVHIYNFERGEWKLEEILKEHDLKVTGIDWAPNTNRYVNKKALLYSFSSIQNNNFIFI